MTLPSASPSGAARTACVEVGDGVSARVTSRRDTREEAPPIAWYTGSVRAWRVASQQRRPPRLGRGTRNGAMQLEQSAGRSRGWREGQDMGDGLGQVATAW